MTEIREASFLAKTSVEISQLLRIISITVLLLVATLRTTIEIRTKDREIEAFLEKEIIVMIKATLHLLLRFLLED
jgi:hypothetical protein